MRNIEALHDLIETKLQDYQLIVVANREPYIHYLARRKAHRVQFPCEQHGDGARSLEMIGNRPFPAIRHGPYFPSMSPHAFFWFQSESMLEENRRALAQT